MDTRDMIDVLIVERIGEILKQTAKSDENRFKWYEAFLKSLDPDRRKLFEELIDSLLDGNGEEQMLVYKTALLDGIHLCLYVMVDFIK